jgi:hypothetical protein
LSALEIQRKACPADVCWCVRKIVKSGERPTDNLPSVQDCLLAFLGRAVE